MARYPVTNAQYKTFIDAGGYSDEQWWQGLVRPEPQASRWPQDNRPKTDVNWYEAMAFSRWLSAQLGYDVRLPAEEEWERAARGRDGREYPWGERYESGYANVNEETFKAGEWHLAQTTAVGVYPQGASSEGVLDLSGNVCEWCLAKFAHPEQIVADLSRNERVLRGGSWDHNAVQARGIPRDRNRPGDRWDSIGFRFVSSAPIA